MPKLSIDLTTTGLIPEGEHVAIVQNLEYQVKTGSSWNYEGTTTVQSFDDYEGFEQRLRYTFNIPGKGNIYQDFYLKESALPFLKNFLIAAGVPFKKDGFDPEEALGKQVSLVIIYKDDGYGIKNVISKIKKA